MPVDMDEDLTATLEPTEPTEELTPEQKEAIAEIERTRELAQGPDAEVVVDPTEGKGGDFDYPEDEFEEATL